MAADAASAAPAAADLSRSMTLAASPIKADPIVITQFRPAHGVQAYLLWAGIPFQLKTAHFPYFESTGDLPQLTHGSYLVGGSTERVLSYLRKLDDGARDLDQAFDPRERADILAYATLVETTLADALSFARWGIAEVYDRHTKPAMSASLLFPLKWLLPWRAFKAERADLDRKGVLAEPQARRRAVAAYTALAERLRVSAPGPYLFGARPCTADAMLYDHLQAALKSDKLRGWIEGGEEALKPLLEYRTRVEQALNAMRPLDAEAPPPPALDAEDGSPERSRTPPTPRTEAEAEPSVFESERRRTDMLIAVGAIGVFIVAARVFANAKA